MHFNRAFTRASAWWSCLPAMSLRAPRRPTCSAVQLGSDSWDTFGDTRLQELPVIHNHPQQKRRWATPCCGSEIVMLSVGESWLGQDYESGDLPSELRSNLVARGDGAGGPPRAGRFSIHWGRLRDPLLPAVIRASRNGIFLCAICVQTEPNSHV